MEFLTVGQVVRTIGLKGEVKVYPSTHFRDTRFKKGIMEQYAKSKKEAK